MYGFRFYSLGFIFGIGTLVAGMFGSGWSLAVCAAGFALCGMFNVHGE